MNNLAVIEHKNERVLTTAQLAEFYGTESNVISKNFQRNKDRYIENSHYYQLTGEELKNFKSTTGQIDDSSRINLLYLWTEKGALLHAKSLNTDEAWDVYNQLVDTYFRAKEMKQNQLDISQLSPELQMFNKIFTSLAQAQLEQKKLNDEINNVKESFAQVKGLLAEREEN